MLSKQWGHLFLDYLIANTDRHYYNFGILRNPDTLEVLGVAPVFDSGTSMWMETPNYAFGVDEESKPFHTKHSKQIKLIKSFDWLDIGLLNGIVQEVESILEKNPAIDDVRRNFIVKRFEKRIEHLQAHVLKTNAE